MNPLEFILDLALVGVSGILYDIYNIFDNNLAVPTSKAIFLFILGTTAWLDCKWHHHDLSCLCVSCPFSHGCERASSFYHGKFYS